MGLERRFPDRFIPRYSMVMFHPEIPYAEALRRGAVQEELLAELDAGTALNPTPRSPSGWSSSGWRRSAEATTRAVAAPGAARASRT